MSNIYLTEPPTHGKVLLHTSFGDIDVELWSKECPMACRNFVQLAMEGYYDNTVFHRVIRKFMVQGGDPTGKSDGGESVYGKPFRDEIHTRIKFNHRGQVAMANENRPGTNHSQFFFTLDSAPHLDKKHTIFGKITGSTIFNALRMGEVDTDKDDRPIEPPLLKSIEVLLNPFDDIVPRNLPGSAKAAAQDEAITAAEEAKRKRRKKQAKKDFKLLSFGEEADQEEKELEAGASGRGIKSAHDALDDQKLSKDAAYDVETVKLEKAEEAQEGAIAAEEGLRKAVKTAARGADKGKREGPKEGQGKAPPPLGEGVIQHPKGFDDGDTFMQKMRRQMMEKRRAMETSRDASSGRGNNDTGLKGEPVEFKGVGDGDEEAEESRGKKKIAAVGYGDDGGDDRPAGWRADDETDREKERRKAIRERAKEYEALREGLKAKHRAVRVMTGEERVKYDAEQKHREMLSHVEQMRAKYKKRRKEAGTREDSTMAKLAKFTSTLRSAKTRVEGETPGKEAEAYSGQVTEGQLYEGEDEADDGDDWFAGPLKFKRHIDDDLRTGSDGRKADDYSVIDPLKKGSSSGGSGSGSGLGGGGRDAVWNNTRRNGTTGNYGAMKMDRKRNGETKERDGKRRMDEAKGKHGTRGWEGTRDDDGTRVRDGMKEKYETREWDGTRKRDGTRERDGKKREKERERDRKEKRDTRGRRWRDGMDYSRRSQSRDRRR